MRRIIKAVCVAAPLVSAVPAMAQVPAQNQDGRAADANLRVGSNGYNDSVRTGSTVGPNAIIYGNTTGGREFRGPINERDPRAFSGPIAGLGSDSFIRGSSSAPLPYQPQIDLSQPQPFYGQSRGVAPPIGTERLGFTGAYLGTGLTPQSPTTFSSEFSSALSDVYAQPLGESVILGARSYGVGTEPGEITLQGPLEAGNQQTLFSGSPLYGVRQFAPGGIPTDTDAAALSGPFGLGRADRFRVQNPEIQRMRQELQNTGTQQQDSNEDPDNNNGDPPNGQQPNGDQQQPRGLARPLESPENAGLNRRIDRRVNLGNGLGNGVETNQGLTRRENSALVTPQQQSAQYNELRRRLQQYENPQMAAIEAQHELQREQARHNQQNKAAPTSRPANTLADKARLNAPHGGGAAPLKVTSLATGVSAKGLHDLLAQAEAQMRQDKFQSAIHTYNAAEQVAPNNSLIVLGRANAELGAGFYQQASADLHRVFLSDRTPLMGQYDLSGWITPQRLQFVTRELQDLQRSDPNLELAPFLLAYLSYNTGHEADAARYLSEAEARAKGGDPLLKTLRTYWKLPGDSNPAPGAGKPAPAPSDLNK